MAALGKPEVRERDPGTSGRAGIEVIDGVDDQGRPVSKLLVEQARYGGVPIGHASVSAQPGVGTGVDEVPRGEPHPRWVEALRGEQVVQRGPREQVGENVLLTLGGRVTVVFAAEHVGGDFMAKTVAGGVIAEKIDGSARVNTLSGAIELAALKSGACRANTVSGRISIGIVAGTDVWMDLDAKAGTVTSELAAGDTSPAPGDSGTSLEVRARSVSGDIYLHRANAYR